MRDRCSLRMIALLAHANFRRVWLVGVISASLRWLELLAIAVYVLEQTGSPSMVALITVLRLAPMFLCGSLIGVIGDRHDRKRILLLGLLSLVLMSAILGALALTEAISLWQIALGTFLSGLFIAADMALRRIVTADIAGSDRLSQAMALEAVSNNATRMIGPVLGGLLLETLGLPGVYLAGALLYLAAVILLLRTTYRSAPVEGEAPAFLGALREGWRYVRGRRVIVAIMAGTVAVNFWGIAYVAMVPVVGEQVLGLSAFPNGVLMSMLGLGALAGAVLMSRASSSRTFTRIFLLSIVVVVLGVLGFSLSNSLPLSLTMNLICGVSIGTFSVMQSSIMILAARPEVRSRVMGLLTVSIGAGQFGGMLHLGWLADWLGAAVAVQISAIEGLAAMALMAVIWPELRRPTDLAPPPTER
ncbi:MAG: MFS transporter [Pseudomonadota bacterium]